MGAFDGELSRRIDAYIAALDFVSAWPDSTAKRECMDVLDRGLRRLLQAVPV